MLSTLSQPISNPFPVVIHLTKSICNFAHTNKMNKCEHNEKITTFCLSDHCEWKQTAGCDRCILKYHNHFTNSKFLNEQQLTQLLSKLSLQTVSKPNSRKIQQSLYSYFTGLKNQLTTSLDLLCKTLINSIGSPYLTQHNLLTVFKRIKNKEYKRLQPKQFKKFYETVKKANPTEIYKQQGKIYKENLNKSQKLIFDLENLLSSYESLFKPINEKFIHQKASFQVFSILIKQTIDSADLSLNLSQFHERQMEKNKAQRAQKQEKNEIKKIFNEYDSMLSTQYSSRLASSTKQKIVKSPEIETPSSIKKQDSLYESINHKFGVRDFGTLQKLQKSDSQQMKNKRPISLDKKIAMNLSLQIPSKNDRKRNEIQIIENLQNLSNDKTQRHKISFPERNESILNDFREDSSTKKPETFILTLFDKKESTLREKEISIRKEQLIEMMKNQALVSKNVQKQKPKEDFQHYSLTNKTDKKDSKFSNNNSLLIKPAIDSRAQDVNPRKNYSTLFEDKNPRQQIKSNQKPKANERKLSETKNQRVTSLSNHYDTLKLPLQKLQVPSIPNIPEDIEKSSQGSLEVLRKILPKKNMNAHPKLPIQEVDEKPKELACSRLIIVPTGSKFQMENSDECDSPLLKKKVTHTATKDNQKLNSKYPKKEKEQKPELRQNQEKSLNLLLKAINLKPEQAILSLEAALKEAPNNLSAAQYLSFLYLQNSKPKQALHICNLILDRFEIITKENEQLLIRLENNKAAALNMLGRYSEAIVLLQKCIKFGQKDTLLKNLGDAYYFSSNYDKAIFYYEKTIKVSPQYDEACYNMAVCLYLQDNFYNASQSILKALEASPKNPEYLELKKHIDLKISQSVKL